MPLRKVVAGNWKMNGLMASADMLEALASNHPSPSCDVLICPPATMVAHVAGRGFAIGGQDCHEDPTGAHTGDISAEMLADAGATAVILGHSERRTDHAETDSTVSRKVAAAWRAGLAAIVCVGETEAERDAGDALTRVCEQLEGSIPDGATGERLMLAYEPVWAIGTGRSADAADIAEVHAALRQALEARFGAAVGQSVRLLYGGSVKPANAAEIFAIENVDGALVGGASLKAEDFGAIIAAAG
jgi:triosephosphate isomerase